jgi:nicotinate-nucleotide adenylyltransferase
MRRVAIFGGSFNPPHVSHVLAVTYVLATAPIDEVLVVPTFEHPFGKSLVSYEHRLAMCELAFADVKRVAISSIEREMGESRTLYLLRALRERHPDWSLRLVVGTDILAEKHKWYAWDDVVALAPLIVLGRKNHEIDGAPAAAIPAVASREIRSAMARGDDVSSVVPATVLAYARTHALYPAEAP